MTLESSHSSHLHNSLAAPTLPVSVFRIELDRSGTSRKNIPEFSPGETISGKLFMTCYDTFRCFEISVELQGIAEVRYVSGNSVRCREDDVLHNKSDTKVTFIKGEWEYSWYPPTEVFIEKSDYEYEFSIPTKKGAFPGSFTGKHGKINYFVRGYIDKYYHKSSLKSTRNPIRIKSYFNLQSVPAVLQPAAVEGQQYKSIFSKKTGLKYSLSLPRTGFLPQEPIPFSLLLVNPCGIRVTRVFVGLAKKLTCVSQVSSKAMKTYVAFLEHAESELLEEWSDFLTIPKNTYPSVSVQIIQHVYTFRVEIYVNENKYPTLQGDVPVTIGTTREMNATLSPMLENVVTAASTIRSHSAMSFSSGTSSLYSIPPPYSQLSSRSPSLYSIETLPPFYEDVVTDMEECENRRRSTFSGGTFTRPTNIK